MLERKTQLVLLGFAGLMMLLPLGLFTFFSFQLGVDLRTGADIPEFIGAPQVRSAVALAWLAVSAFVTMRTVNYRGDPDAPAGLLTTVPVFDAVVGFLLAEAVVVGAWAALPMLVFAGSLAVGAHAAAPVLALPVVGAVVLAWAVPVGFLVGIVVRHALLTVDPIASNRTALIIVAMVAYFGLLMTDAFGVIVSAIFPFLAALPVGWIGDLLVLDLPRITAAPVRILGSVAITAVVVPVLVTASARVAEAHWLADGVIEGDDDSDADTVVGDSAIDRIADLLPDGVGRPTRSVVRAVVVRARRSPVQLLYLIYPLFAAFPVAQDIYTAGSIPGYLPWLLPVFVIWAAGAAFTLNVLGEQGSTMPVVLSAPSGPRHVLLGNVGAGVLLGLVPGAAIAVIVGLLGPTGVPQAVALGVLTAVGVVGANMMATGIGVAFPRFGTVQVMNNREAIAPSKSAFAIFTLLVLPFGPICWLLVSAGGPGALVDALGLTTPAVAVRAVAAAVLLAWLAVAAGSMRYALDRIGTYTLE
ncbi:hypothetical protein SAMN06269185_1757 [Natronoarchaeum philippinense]|uniref:ABC-2 type transport system permease protein n=1 Tax=Natronoarchaeum philippinense TaxID=558529 RepID=A0A285NSG4_NATPI|nr:hypothetical protein [Natronoarchaeum philippinense]SNZ12462.1 hypothetical protein SAMN06269185_1757 [Natronoarchaeum philippinense]